MALATAFNRAALGISAEVAAATKAFAKKPGNLNPFKQLEETLQERRLEQAKRMIASSPPMTALSDLANIFTMFNTAAEELRDAPMLEAAQKMTNYMIKMEHHLGVLAERLEENRQHVLAAQESNRVIMEDHTIFADAVSKLPAQYAANEKACHGDIAAMAERAARTQTDFSRQDMQMKAMLESSEEECARVASLQSGTRAKMAALAEAVRSSETFKDFIDSCSTGTRTATTVGKPLSLRRPQTPA